MKVPIFYPNLEDNLHCFQACLKSALEERSPHLRITYREVDELTGFKPELLTWPMRAYLRVAQLGYRAVIYDPMDFSKFSREPVSYMDEVFGTSASQLYQRESDIVTAVKDSTALFDQDNLMLFNDVPDDDVLRALVDDGFLCICHVDQKILDGADDQGDHVVLVYDYSETDVVFHDPGLPPKAERRCKWDRFSRAWSSPSEFAKTIFAIGDGDVGK